MAQPPPGPGGLYRAPPIYRFAGTALGASMWFFVCILMQPSHYCHANPYTVDVPREERWYGHSMNLVKTTQKLTQFRSCIVGLEASLGPLNVRMRKWHRGSQDVFMCCQDPDNQEIPSKADSGITTRIVGQELYIWKGIYHWALELELSQLYVVYRFYSVYVIRQSWASQTNSGIHPMYLHLRRQTIRRTVIELAKNL